MRRWCWLLLRALDAAYVRAVEEWFETFGRVMGGGPAHPPLPVTVREVRVEVERIVYRDRVVLAPALAVERPAVPPVPVAPVASYRRGDAGMATPLRAPAPRTCPDAVTALMGLGYRKPVAEGAVTLALQGGATETADIVRAALRAAMEKRT